MATRNGPNWGAGLQTLGRGLQSIAERQRLQREAELQRQQQLDDLAAAQARQDQMNTERWGPVTPPQVYLGQSGMPTTTGMFGGMRAAPAIDLKNAMYPQAKPAPIPSPTVAVTLVKRDGGGQATFNVKEGELDTLVRSGDFDIGGQGDGSITLVERTPPPPASAISNPRSYAQEQQDYKNLRAQVADQVAAAVGSGTENAQRTVYNPRKNAFISADVTVPQGGSAYGRGDLLSLATPESFTPSVVNAAMDSMALRGFDAPAMPFPRDVIRNAAQDVWSQQPKLLSPQDILNYGTTEKTGWTFDNGGTPNDPADDRFVRKAGMFNLAGQELDIPTFIATQVAPKTDADGKVAFGELKKLFKDQYGVDLDKWMAGEAIPAPKVAAPGADSSLLKDAIGR